MHGKWETTHALTHYQQGCGNTHLQIMKYVNILKKKNYEKD